MGMKTSLAPEATSALTWVEKSVLVVEVKVWVSAMVMPSSPHFSTKAL